MHLSEGRGLSQKRQEAKQGAGRSVGSASTSESAAAQSADMFMIFLLGVTGNLTPSRI